MFARKESLKIKDFVVWEDEMGWIYQIKCYYFEKSVKNYPLENLEVRY
jgi:hypothetical protein